MNDNLLSPAEQMCPADRDCDSVTAELNAIWALPDGEGAICNETMSLILAHGRGVPTPGTDNDDCTHATCS